MISPLQYFAGAGFTLIGIVILIIGWRDFRQQLRFVRQSIRTTGEVVGVHREDRNTEDVTYHHPTIRFTTAAGASITFTAAFGRSKPWNDGERVPVRYHPDRPDSAELDTFFGIWLTTVICAVLGIAGLASGALLFLVPPES